MGNPTGLPIPATVGLLETVDGQTSVLPPFSAYDTGTVAINNLGAVAIPGFTTSWGTVVYVGQDAVASLDNNPWNPWPFPLGLGGGFMFGFSSDLALNDNNAVALGVGIVVPSSDPWAANRCFPCLGQGLNNRNQRLALTFGPAGRGGTLDLLRFDFAKPQPNSSHLALTVVETNRVGTIPSDMSAFGSQFNDSGTVVYYGGKDDGTFGIYQASGVPVVESTSTGPNEFIGFGAFALNNNGEVAFLSASLTLGHKRGFFRGPHPLTDKIVLEGDIVAGSQVFQIRLPQANATSISFH